MKHVICHDIVLSQEPEGPLVAWLEGFAGAVRRQGYGRHSLHRRILLAAAFSRWLQQEKIDPSHVNSEHPAMYLLHRAHRLKIQLGDAPALQHFIHYLRRQAVIPAAANMAPRETEIQRCVRAYERYLREARGLAPTTILSYAPFIRTFLEHRFGTDRVHLSALRAVDVVEFVQRMAPTMKKKRAKVMTSTMRSFCSAVHRRRRGVPVMISTR